MTCGVYLRPSGSSPTRCISRSCSACNSITDGDGATAATIARGLRAAERGQAIEPQLEILAPDLAEHPGDFLRDFVIDIADEAQRQMVVFGIDPARARQPAAQQRQRFAQRGRYFQTCEQSRHCRSRSNHDCIGFAMVGYDAP